MKRLLTCFTFFISLHSFCQSNTFAGATLVPTTVTCVTGTNQFTGHSIFTATNEATLAITGNNCSSANNTPDMWYKFTAQTEFPVITVTPTGSSWTTSQFIKVQILAGSALGSLMERGCVSSANSGTIIGTAITATPTTALTIGTTYYVRISKSGTGNPTGSNANWTYNLCIREAASSRMGEVFKQTVLSAANVLNYPWEIAYGPDDSLWITEARGYKVYKMHPGNGGKRTVLDLSSTSTWFGTSGTGDDTLYAQNMSSWNSNYLGWPQGGFAGLALHPRLGDGSGHDYVYVTYIWKYVSGTNMDGVYYYNKLVRFTYNSTTGRLGSPAVLEARLPGSGDHNSQRLTIAPVVKNGTNYLFMGQGDLGAGQFGNRYRTNNAQNVNSYEGKILRFNLESDNPVTGETGNLQWIPNDNPYLSGTSAVYSIGIRNNQGFAYDTATNILYGASHGPYSDDEINAIESGKNYGHPRVIGYKGDGNYNGSAAVGTATSVSPGAPYSDANQTSLWYYPSTAYTPPVAYTAPYNGKSSLAPIGDENANATAIGASYKDPIFCAYASSYATVLANWTGTANGGWESEAWSGLDIYSNKVIPGWNRSLVAAGLKWGRLIKLNLNPTGTATLPSNVTGSNANQGDTVTYFQSSNRYRDLAFGPNGKDVYLVMDNSSATSGPGTANPSVPGCQGCVVKYSFLGYAADGSTSFGGSTISKSIDVTAPATNNVCIPGTQVTINAANNNTNLWVPITGPDGNILAEIFANGNDLGLITSSVYKNGNAIRVKGSTGTRYLDRNITITPQNQPTLPAGNPLVKVRLYISKAEFDALDADVNSGLTGTGAINLLKVLKNSDVCGSAITAATTAYTPTNIGSSPYLNLQQTGSGASVSGYVYQIDIPSFSSFYFATSNVTLPLDLLTFKGNLQSSNSVLLQWETANEINTSHFIVERSSDAVNFSSIGTVSAHGNTSTNTQYSLTDNNISNFNAPVIYYRLKMVDIDGQYKYSNIVPITLADITANVSVAPNPVATDMKVTIASPADGKVQWKLIDIAGRVVMQSSAHVKKGFGNNIVINMEKMTSGSYYLTVTGAGIDKKVKLEKL